MHRSGTSCLTGCLQRSGLNLGKVNHSGRYNAKGNHEQPTINRLHDEILALNNSSWHQPADNIQIHSFYSQKIQTYLEKIPLNKPFGIKDPRLTLLVKHWISLTTIPYELVASFRHPLAVADSLHHRNKFDKEIGIDLWLKYNSKLISLYQEQPFPIIEYNLYNKQVYLQSILSIIEHLGLSAKKQKVSRFIEESLEHQNYTDTDIPERCLSTYNDLRRIHFK
ncbi:MAG: hypothetical protein K0U68_06955 [Gammaproteobacteria bacterium]|nr:hypothetical protein [Gammaproteobacteria bacterium]